MDTRAFDFELPRERIAQAPVEPRDRARLLVRPTGGGEARDSLVRDLPDWLRPGDLLVLNDTRVLPARVQGRRETGGQVELLFLEPVLPGTLLTPESTEVAPGADVWRAMVKPARKIKAGECVACSGGVVARFLEREAESGYWLARLEPGQGGHVGTTTEELMAIAGAMPLPPYIERPATEADTERYQTVYARKPGAVAAPTAGLHLTEDLLQRLDAMGVRQATVTLHVGAGTFLPVTADRIEDHRMHSERFELGEEAAAEVRACRERGGRVVPVGTTSARVLESCALRDPDFERDIVEARAGSTDIFLHPGSGPRVCDGLFTNFHLPKSTLLMLVASFIGVEEMRELYRTAIEREYRFYSYGDASLLWRRPT
ncbi:S-adenosylmethionine:tRNA ribosyltransferase-isomerase [Planctomycetes bacterium Poly30]|uniref:S-adenosylmethionine:tRNA ribosyltransferase-isomerase n=1 Tax=Saltatorellus ferox TaxID=2528018 RepID=A0A518EX93_9BACT|nr:S-adenosylmethionine:tRNA ribosyltransferase-isomerase [Planctomycetes bacterium Poly30]